MIKDIVTGKRIVNDILELPSVYTSAANAYSMWAAEIGVSDSISLSGLLAGDDGCTEIDIGFPIALDGLSTKVMQSTEGSIGIYVDEPPGTLSSTQRAISAILADQRTVSRAYTSRSTVNPSLIINCKDPSTDAKSFDGKWQKTTDVAILFIKWSTYSSSSANNVDVAIRMQSGSLEIVCTCGNGSNNYLQIFMMDSTSASGNAVAGNGNMGKLLTTGTTYTFRSVTPKRIAGNVLGVAGTAIATTVRAYLRNTGQLSGEVLSNAVTGDYVITTYVEGEHYVVCLPEPSSTVNALILDKVLPVE